GRVMAFYAQAMMGVGPLGATQAGVLALIFGAPTAMWVGAAACALVIIAVRACYSAVFTLEPDDYKQSELGSGTQKETQGAIGKYDSGVARRSRTEKNSSPVDRLLADTSDAVGQLIRENRSLRLENVRLQREV